MRNAEALLDAVKEGIQEVNAEKTKYTYVHVSSPDPLLCMGVKHGLSN
jgi:hypothetical protein